LPPPEVPDAETPQTARTAAALTARRVAAVRNDLRGLAGPAGGGDGLWLEAGRVGALGRNVMFRRRSPATVLLVALALGGLLAVPATAHGSGTDSVLDGGADWTGQAPTLSASQPRTATMTLSPASGIEGDSGTNTLIFTLSVSGYFDGTISGVYLTRGEGEGHPPGEPAATATPDLDYESTSGSFFFTGPGDQKTIRVSVYGDTLVEPDEFFYLQVRSMDLLDTEIYNKGVIRDDDYQSGSTLSIDDAAVSEGDTGETSADFTVTLSPAASVNVKVDYGTCGAGCDPQATASPGDDYDITSGTLTFYPGQTSKTIHVPVYGDLDEEGDEYFFAILSDPVNAELGDDEWWGVGTIVDDDAPVLCNGEVATIEGTPEDDELTGTPGRDVISGLGGADVISGRGGDDLICGDDGDDLLLGGSGNDTILGGEGNDKLRGAAGDDTLMGEGGSDRLLPETGDDIANGGAGSDIVDYLAADGPVIVDLGAGTATYTPPGESWTHTLVLVEKVDGSSFGDILMGDGKRNVLRGKQGPDQIWGFAGDDDLIGGTHDDLLYGGDGDDLVKGQADDDSLYGEDGADRLVGGNGNDGLWGGIGDDLLIGGLKNHLGAYLNTLDGGDGFDTCRWEPTAIDCEP
jgi:Ca2+-binding RTX toxin-like protein